MKRIFITAMMLLAVGSVTAQKSRQYDDDIYGGKPSKQEEPATRSESRSADNDQTYSSSGSANRDADYNSSTRQYSSDEYYDSDDNDYYYSSRINRFNRPFYNRPYWSTFYNPYWYDPFWVDPYWGWSPWTSGPGISISIGSGPYWSSYWGWSSWYGNPYFGSYYGYPSYGYGGYYSGYWNGYYAGLYNGNDNYYRSNPRNITYGPRYNLRPVSASAAGFSRNGYNGFREAPNRSIGGNMNTETTPVRNGGFRPTQNGAAAGRDDRSQSTATTPRTIEFGPGRTDDRPVRNGWNEVTTDRNNVNTQQQAPRENNSNGSGWFGRNRGDAPVRSSETPRVQEQRNFQETPRAQQQYNTESAPVRSSGFDRGGGGGSFGGSRGGGGNGGGGGSFGGGGGRRR